MENYSSYDYASYAGEAAWAGMKRGYEGLEGKHDAAVMEKRYRCNDDDDDDKDSEHDHRRWKLFAAYAPSAGAKRGYERSEEEIDAELVDKRYKCNYWEDPACAKLLQARGGRKAKHAARLNQTYRVIKGTDEWCAGAATLRDRCSA